MNNFKEEVKKYKKLMDKRLKLNDELVKTIEEAGITPDEHDEYLTRLERAYKPIGD